MRTDTPYDAGYHARRWWQAPGRPPNPHPAGSPEAIGFDSGVDAAHRAWEEDNERERMQHKHGRWD